MSVVELSQRQLQVGHEIRRLLMDVFIKQQLRDPDLYNVSITVTEVRVTPDLREATAFVLPLGGKDLEQVLRGLKRASGFFRTYLAHHLKLRVAPIVHFRPDHSFDYASHIQKVLTKVQEADRGRGDLQG
ncbi:MAG TPA: 30S ribosome-binding factor RbfA [Alphaproteobacteria bacterium]|nr:30S ribosome-binding factor RbfA [Alphaproteobacteria bacterium]